MRKSILPLVIILLCSSFYGYSQGTSCTNAVSLGVLTGTCTNVPIDLSTGYSTGPHQLACSPNYPDNAVGGKVVYIQFHPTSATSCVKISLSTNTLPANPVRMEAALYTGTCTAPPDPNTISTANSMCFKDGVGVWTKLSTTASWPGWNGTKFYFLRVYIADPIVTANVAIPPKLNVCATEASPANDLCSTAVRIDGTLNGGDNVCANGGASEPINGGIPDPNGPTKPNPAPAWVCAGILQNTVWYSYIVQANGASSITISSVNCDFFNSNTQAYIQMGLMVGGCSPANILPPGSSPWNAVCTTVGPGAPSGNLLNATLNAPSLPAGTVVLVAMDGYLNANCQYNFSIANAIPIPIKLKYFGVWEEGQGNHAKWVTSSEFNNAYFELQRSVDGTNFESVGRIAGSQHSEIDINYGFDDKFPPAVAYYRLAQFDLDNKSTFSDVVRVVRKDNSAYFDVSFANPVHNVGIVNIKCDKGGVTNLQVVDVAGRTVSSQIVATGRGNNPISKDFSRLVPGTYFLVAIQGENRIVKSFIKQ